MLFQDQDFSWLRHVLIAAGLLTGINLLVIFAPNILGIFGIIGEALASWGVAPEAFSPAEAGGLLSPHLTSQPWLLAVCTARPPTWDVTLRATPGPSWGSEPVRPFPSLGRPNGGSCQGVLSPFCTRGN